MINPSLMKYSMRNIKRRKLRSFLTILSVFIGVTAVFTLLSFGYGLLGFVGELAEEMGEDKLIIQPKGQGFGPPSPDINVIMDDDDVDFVEGIIGVEEATGVYFSTAEIEFDDVTRYAFIIGSDIKDHGELIEEVYTLDIDRGRNLRGREKTTGVFGYNYQFEDEIFPTALELGDNVVINGKKIRVVGFYQTAGNPTDDASIYLNHAGFEGIFEPESYYYILVRSSPGTDPSRLANVVQEKLRKERGQSRGNEDFFVQTFEQVIESFTSILSTINAVLVLVALISLVVAGVNIANTMYASILERTKEIGVMKSIGARNGEILFLFTFESAFLSLLGGVLGMLTGTAISAFAGKMISASGFGVLQPAFDPILYVGCALFSIFIGFISGFMPAYRASKLNPVDSLRYE